MINILTFFISYLLGLIFSSNKINKRLFSVLILRGFTPRQAEEVVSAVKNYEKEKKQARKRMEEHSMKLHYDYLVAKEQEDREKATKL